MATTTELEARVRELEDKLRSMESDGERSMRGMIDEVFPPESRKHMREAWKHNLMAVRSVLDHWIERQDESNTSGTKRRESIRVD
jgi:phosphoenolpyruvate synthase/pyruvate phosphate dikinase